MTATAPDNLFDSQRQRWLLCLVLIMSLMVGAQLHHHLLKAIAPAGLTADIQPLSCSPETDSDAASGLSNPLKLQTIFGPCIQLAHPGAENLTLGITFSPQLIRAPPILLG